MILIEFWLLLGYGLRILRGGRGAFPGNFCGDSLGKFAKRAIVDEQSHLRLAEHIDKAG